MPTSKNFPQQNLRQNLKKTHKSIRDTMLWDRFVFRQKMQTIENKLLKGDKREEAKLIQLQKKIATSISKREFRAKNLPKPTYPHSLPVVEQRYKIAKLITDNQVIVLCGETGSGKTTQLPKICLDLGRGVAGLIGMTQPRRIAARSIAQFIGDDIKQTSNGKMPNAVGYKMRFADQIRDDTFIKV
ncbi:MAG: ATP-dependent helicase, partial [Magnetococcales bacterium]|nr:ATP-dependent helicase [Magnetococcales bacterium]